MVFTETFQKYTKKLCHQIIQGNLFDLPANPLKTHLQQHPKSTWPDLYKFVLQGTCGWAHLIRKNEHQIYKQLTQELSQIKILLNDFTPLIEKLDERTNFARLHLRPWKSKFRNEVQPIWESMKTVLKHNPGDLTLFRKRWKMIQDFVSDKILRVEKKEEETLISWIILILDSTEDLDPATALPLIPHSPIFRKEYYPSYRIVYYPDFQK